MPYTPPTHRSPVSSKPNSPILTRNHSYSEASSAASTANRPSPRPALPRSVSSTSYLNKHRRTPSLPNHHDSTNGHAASGKPNISGTSRQGRGASVNGAVTTPPDSSDDDEERGRRSIGNLKQLQEALQHINVKRDHSPTRDAGAETVATIVATSVPARLTAEARKISHSRSASEITLSQHGLDLNNTTVISSSDGSDAEDDELRIKPPLLRKKSGELVKPALRPSSRRRPSSMPGTPTYAKAVHFNEDMEQVRHFLQLDRPIAVSAGSSPVETYNDDEEYPFGYDDGHRSTVVEWEIKLANFPGDTYERKTAPVRVERIFLSSDHKTLIGTVAVANIAFSKLVVARFTLDYWKTTSEVVAEYNHDVRKKQSNDGYDRFNFNIKLADQANLESKTLLLCVRYNVNGQEFWDNNNSMNYQVDFIKKTKPRAKSGSGSLGAIPRSRNSPLGTRPKSMPVGSFDDDFEHSVDGFGTGRGFLRAAPNPSIRLKPKSKRGNIFPDQGSRGNSSGQAFSSRYDFSASLSAALSNAQNAIGDRSGLKVKKTGQDQSDDSKKASEEKPSSGLAPVPGTRPDPLSVEKPDLQSAEYNELIQRFCFFGTPGKGSPKVSSPPAKNSIVDGATDYISNNSSGSNHSSTSNSPASPPTVAQVDGADDVQNSTLGPVHFLGRSNSPGPMTGSGPEDRMTSPFQYGYNLPGSFFPERSHTPQACM